MDLFLGKVTQQAMNYAIRSGVTLTATYAIRQSSKLIRASPNSDVRDELVELQLKMQHKIQIISPAIDMIDLIAARGHTSLESAVSLTKELRYDIQALSQRLARAAEEENRSKGLRVGTSVRAQNESEMRLIVKDMKRLLDRIEDAVPLINLAITTSGATLSTQLPSTVSPSRLLQASTFLTAGDTQYSISPERAVQVGPRFNLTVYMLFAGHNRPSNEEELRDTTWKEVIHKARVKLRRVPLDVVVGTGSGSDAIPSVEISSCGADSNATQDSRIPAESRHEEYAYQLMIIEDFDDDRVHDFDDGEAQPGPFDDVSLAGLREMIPVHEISKIFYADTSKVLNISPESGTHNPVLLLKRDVNASPPRRMIERDNIMPNEHETNHDDSNKTADERQYVEQDHTDRRQDPWRLPPSLDPEWIAFEVYQESDDSDSESDNDKDDTTNPSPSHFVSSLSQLNIRSRGNPNTALIPSASQFSFTTTAPPPWVDQVKTSLSLLELLLRLTSLQQFQQQSHLSITDELLNFFLEESASTGAGGDESHRQAVRAHARSRVGWDPYNESPLKRRGEEYQQYGGRPYQEFYDADSAAGMLLGSPSPGGERQPWSPASGVQTRSMTGVSSDGGYPSPSPSLNQNSGAAGEKGRMDFIRRESQGVERRGSPLRQSTNRSVRDEGLGTSPASSRPGK